VSWQEFSTLICQNPYNIFQVIMLTKLFITRKLTNRAMIAKFKNSNGLPERGRQTRKGGINKQFSMLWTSISRKWYEIRSKLLLMT